MASQTASDYFLSIQDELPYHRPQQAHHFESVRALERNQANVQIESVQHGVTQLYRVRSAQTSRCYASSINQEIAINIINAMRGNLPEHRAPAWRVT